MTTPTLADIGREFDLQRDGKTQRVTLVTFNPAVDDEVLVRYDMHRIPHRVWVPIADLTRPEFDTTGGIDYDTHFERTQDASS